ncbi:deacylase [Citrobacter amalonaticus Y19]|uniref:Deacylase n=1 Tax=Citrobacter amalonaticus Y19 TaxID=1261127 RepID=A0A0F6TVK7_CITAM|nr:N(2)-acetyl-L-2,4-diaminobutanoate deacetylase DoeB [Citrobacter amalonaticus]AKE59401.1 deacylase [Citrobacter amalonaticus Y19]
MLAKNPISSTIDFAADGVHHGYLKLPYSCDSSAWGAIMIPVTVIKNGNGRTALLTGANHGDEYEGPVALSKLTSTINVADVHGRIIIVPFMNTPAFMAGTRTSPIDHGNMNRSFPGAPDGTVTQKIADYFQRTLLPLSDIVVDIHSGGKTLDFLPFAASHILQNKVLQQETEQLVAAFSAPYSVQMLELDSVGMFDTAVEAAGKLFVTTELGGGGSSSAKSIAIAERGVTNVLIRAGILDGELQLSTSICLTQQNSDCFITCEHDGLFEICYDLGAMVNKGDIVARVHDMKRTGVKPTEYAAKCSGIVTARHFPGVIHSGDNMLVISEVVNA